MHSQFTVLNFCIIFLFDFYTYDLILIALWIIHKIFHLKINKLIKEEKKEQWEKFIIKTVRNSLPGHLTSNFFFLPYLPWPQVPESSRFNYRPMVSDSSIKFEAWEPSSGKHDASGVETTPLIPSPFSRWPLQWM